MRKLLAAAAALAALVAVPAAPANATPISYLDALNDAGLVVYDASAAVQYGWAMCNALNTNTGDVVASAVFLSTTWADVPNIGVAVLLVETAVEQLCPWHDHRGGYLV